MNPPFLLVRPARCLRRENHGYETPKQALETNSKALCGVLDPPLCGIVRLTNFNSPIVTFRLFVFEI